MDRAIDGREGITELDRSFLIAIVARITFVYSAYLRSRLMLAEHPEGCYAITFVVLSIRLHLHLLTPSRSSIIDFVQGAALGHRQTRRLDPQGRGSALHGVGTPNQLAR